MREMDPDRNTSLESARETQVSLAASLPRPEPSRVCFDQLKLWRGKKKGMSHAAPRLQ